jgi:hypothetical protein
MDEKTNPDGWLLREWIHELTHRWDIIIGFILVGSIIGLGLSFIFPSYYRASRDIYVGLYGYRFAEEAYAGSLAGQQFRLMDDYKNWQMEQLDELVTSDNYLQATLNLLRENDPYWESIMTEDFRKMASTLWRNAGEWQLVLEDTKSTKASQAVIAWEKIVLLNVIEAVDNARRVVGLDIEMRQLTLNIQDLEIRRELLLFVGDRLGNLTEGLESSEGEANISSRELSNILSIVSQAADWGPGWNRILNQAPRFGCSNAEILAWIDDASTLIEEEQRLIPEQISMLNEQFLSKNDQYKKFASNSYGLSSTLVVEGADQIDSKIEKVRQTGVFIIVGAVFGLSGWVIWAFRRINSKVLA